MNRHPHAHAAERKRQLQYLPYLNAGTLSDIGNWTDPIIPAVN